jgi:AraC-like DNA-binding protein
MREEKHMFFISTDILRNLIVFTSKRGITTDNLFKMADVDKSLLANTDNRVPLEVYYHMVDTAIEMTGDPHFGLHMGENSDPGGLSVLGYIMSCCNTVGEALKKVGNYLGIIGSVLNIYLEVEGDNATLVYDMRKHYTNRCIKQCINTGLCHIYCIIKNIAKEAVELKEVRVRAEIPEDMSEYNRIFNCPILFNQPKAALVFPLKALDIPIRHSNPDLLMILEHHANSFLSKIDDNDHFSRKISLLLLQQIQGNKLTIEDVAKKLGMGVRVIQKKLQEEGVTFNELSTNVRQELAKSYLNESRYTIGDITYMLGFSEPSTFCRAFRMWTGMTPGQYRSSEGSTFMKSHTAKL